MRHAAAAPNFSLDCLSTLLVHPLPSWRKFFPPARRDMSADAAPTLAFAGDDTDTKHRAQAPITAAWISWAQTPDRHMIRDGSQSHGPQSCESHLRELDMRGDYSTNDV